jgi:hypothetical protein
VSAHVLGVVSDIPGDLPALQAVAAATHDELASLAGSRLTVERLLHELRDSGQVRTGRGQITVEQSS